jgi:cytochrome c oxidase assembly protein Cox11
MSPVAGKPREESDIPIEFVVDPHAVNARDPINEIVINTFFNNFSPRFDPYFYYISR